MKFANGIFATTLALALTGPTMWAQTAPAAKPDSDATPTREQTPRNRFELMPEQTFYVNNAYQASDLNEINTALRNLLPPNDKLYLVPSQSVILVSATSEDLALVQKLLNDLDRPKKTYRLTYTVTESDNGKRVGTQHFAMVLVSGQTATLKQGSKVPVATGSYNSGSAATDKNPAGVQTQFTYLDVGMNFEATLLATGNNAMLKSSVEQSSIAPEQSGVGPQDPIVRQTSLKGMFLLSPGKPLILGSVDIPGSTRHLDVEAVMEPLP